MKVELYSHSRLSSFEDCPRKFQYRYVLKVPSDSESIEGFVGKRVHEVLERLYEYTSSGRVPSLARVIERFRLWWDERFDPARIRIVRAENPPAYYRELGERCLTNYYRRHYPFDADETLAIEERVTFPLDEAGRYRIQGFVDRVVRARDGVLEVHDYKTSQRVPSQKRLDQDRQLAFYQLGVRERFGPEPVRLVWHYLLLDQLRVSERSDEQLAKLREDTIRLIDRIHGETRYEPRPGPLCGWCEFSDLCPEGPKRPASAAPQPPPEASRGQLPLLPVR